MTALTEGRHAGGFIVSEANGHRSRSTGTLASGETVEAGQVLGRKSGTPDVSVQVTAGAGNGGNGVLTMANPATGAGVMGGVYIAVCIAEASNGGTFRVFAPDGSIVGAASVGVAFDDDVKFTIADGGDDFDIGDSFRIAVSMTSDAVLGELAAFDPEADDGTEDAAAIAFDNVDAADGALPVVTIERDAEVSGDDLVWPAGIASDDKAAAIAALAARGIIIR